MKLISTICPICNSKNNYTVLYKSNFQSSDLNIKTFSARRLPDKIHYQIVKCKNDGLIRSNPIISQNNLESLYKQSDLTYEDEVLNLTKTYISILKPVLNKISQEDKILEIGCGNGFILKDLNVMGYKNIQGIEPGVNAYQKADQNIQKKIINDIFKTNIFKAQSFNLIFSFQTFDHIAVPNSFLKECWKILKPGGYLLIFNHDIESFSAQLLKENSPIIDIEHTYFYSQSTISKLFQKNNFETLYVCSPKNILTLKHFIWLFPLHKKLKQKILSSDNIFLNHIFKLNLSLNLGNLCITAIKKDKFIN